MKSKSAIQNFTSTFLLAAILTPYAARAYSPEAAAHADLQNSVEGQAMLRFAQVRMQTRFYSMPTVAQTRFITKTEKLLLKVERKLKKQTQAEYEARFNALTLIGASQGGTVPEELDADYQSELKNLGLADEVNLLQTKKQKEIRYVEQDAMLNQVQESLVKIHQYQQAKLTGHTLLRAPATVAGDILFPIILLLPIIVSIALGLALGWAFLLIAGVALGSEMAYLAIGTIILGAGGM